MKLVHAAAWFTFALGALAVGCSYSPSSLTCEAEGATRNGAICRDGVWVNMNAAPDDADEPSCENCEAPVGGTTDPVVWPPIEVAPELVLPGFDPLVDAPELTITFDRPAAEDVDDFVALVDVQSRAFVTEGVVFVESGRVLDHELESFDPNTGRILAWVRLPTLAATGDTTVVVRLAEAADPEPDPEEVWGDFEAVFHMTDATNATGSADGRDYGSVATMGWIGQARSFDGVDQWIDTRVRRDLEEWSVSVWVNGANMPMASAQVNGPLMRDGNYEIVWDHPDVQFAGAAGVQSDDDLFYASFGALAGQQWHHLAATFDGEELRSYRNGVMVAVNDVGDEPDAPNDPAAIGRSLGTDDVAAFFAGLVDEVRIAETVHSTDWYEASYRNQFDPASFYTVSY